jgi:predicted  nucleic acid-binding Zn-ribbon protein
MSVVDAQHIAHLRYLKRRRDNNESAIRSRAKKRRYIEARMDELDQLREENKKLREENRVLQSKIEEGKKEEGKKEEGKCEIKQEIVKYEDLIQLRETPIDLGLIEELFLGADRKILIL